MRSYKHRDHDIVIHLADDHNVMLGDEYTEIVPEDDDAGGAVREEEEEKVDSSAPPAPAPRQGRGRPRKTAK
nr:MAG TPA: AT hook containing protein [Caudoviricetes sp.]